MDATQGSEASKSLLGPLNGKFSFKKNEDGTKNVDFKSSLMSIQFSSHALLPFNVLEFEFFIWGPLADMRLKMRLIRLINFESCN